MQTEAGGYGTFLNAIAVEIAVKPKGLAGSRPTRSLNSSTSVEIQPKVGRMHSSNQSVLDAARVTMKEKGYRWTKSREAVIRALAAATQPETIEALFGSLRDQRCDLVTVYRILGVLETVGLVRRQFQHNGTAVFDLSPSQATCWVSSHEGTNWQPLPEADVEGLRAAAKSVSAQLSAAGFRDVVPVIQFYADRA